jgi:formiminotetrahydrofolate cyclodeaminase
MTQLVDQSVSDLLRSFSRPTPTPGGGSASALTGAVGAALLVMVAGMTKTRSGSAAERGQLDRVLPGLLDGRDQLASLVDSDSRAYDAVTAAYRLPKGTDEETRVRRLAIQDAMHGATEVPLDVMRAAHAAARQAIHVASHGNPSASSDVTVALALLDAAFRGAAANVEINVGSLKNAGYVEGVRGEVERLEGSMAEALTLARAALAGSSG